MSRIDAFYSLFIRIYLSLGLFITLMLSGIWISLTCNRLIIIWIGLELNLYSFIPLISINITKKTKEAATKYFIAQSIGSALLLVAVTLPITYKLLFINYSLKILVLIMALILKCGIPPLHFWFPRTIIARSWVVCWFLSVPQKLPLLVILSIIPFRRNVFMVVGCISLLWGRVIINKQTSLRGVLAYSSIGQIGWVLVLSQINYLISGFIVINYILLVSIIIIIRRLMGLDLGQISNINFNSLYIYMLIIQFFHLSGFPPFLGFLLKAWAINNLITQNLGIILFIFLLGTVFSLIFYFKSILFIFWVHRKAKLNLRTLKFDLYIILLTIISLVSWVVLLMLVLPLIILYF